MTVNITINADTLELTNVDGMTRIVCNDTEKKDKPESECDWIVRRKLKPRKLDELNRVEDGLYFYRNNENSPWQPALWKMSLSALFTEGSEFIGPITPDMFL